MQVDKATKKRKSSENSSTASSPASNPGSPPNISSEWAKTAFELFHSSPVSDAALALACDFPGPAIKGEVIEQAFFLNTATIK